MSYHENSVASFHLRSIRSHESKRGSQCCMQQSPKHGNGGCPLEVSISSPSGTRILRQPCHFSAAGFLGEFMAEFQAVCGAQPPWIWNLLMLAEICQCWIFSCGCYGTMHLLKSQTGNTLSLFLSVNLISRRFHSYKFGIHQQVSILFPSCCEVNLCSVARRGRVEDQVNCQLH